MDFAFSDGRAVGSECRRILMEELEGAFFQLAHFDEDPDVAIHETRKHNKRLRSVLLLARPVLDSGDLSPANRLIRDAARLFSAERDALVFQDACDQLARLYPTEIDSSFETVRRVLATRHADLLQNGDLPGKIARAVEDFREAGEIIERWNWSQVNYGEVFSAVVSNYRLGFQDFERTRTSRDPEECHDWRKRAKYLSYHLTLLTPLDPIEIGEWARVTTELASGLGEHHDLALFEIAMGDGSDFGISEKAARTIAKLSAKRRMDLEDLAFAEAKIIYRDTAEELHRKFAALVGTAD